MLPELYLALFKPVFGFINKLLGNYKNDKQMKINILQLKYKLYVFKILNVLPF